MKSFIPQLGEKNIVRVFQKPTVCFLKGALFSYMETCQQFLSRLHTKEYFENGKSSQWAAHVTEEGKGLTLGISGVLIQCLFLAKPVRAGTATVSYFVEKAHKRNGTEDPFACWLTCGSQPMCVVCLLQMEGKSHLLNCSQRANMWSVTWLCVPAIPILNWPRDCWLVVKIYLRDIWQIKFKI